MTTFFRNLFSNHNSFWLGFIAGALFVWMIGRLRGFIPALIQTLKSIPTSIRGSLVLGSDQRYRKDIIHFAQRQHITATMFSVDEIIIEPSLMIPPVQVSYDNQAPPIDTVNLTIPYIPDWPELGAIYQTPKISLVEALQNGANIAIAGNPGSGKSTALAYLASQIARKSPQVGCFINFIPLLIHAVDITAPLEIYHSSIVGNNKVSTNFPEDEIIIDDQSLKDALIQTVSQSISIVTQHRLPKFLQAILNENRAVLLIDGIDELPPDRINNVNLFIQAFQNKFPKIQIIASVSFENTAKLPVLGFHIYAMAAWGDSEKTTFVSKWDKLWAKLPKTNVEDASKCAEEHLMSWLSVHDTPCTPLELTLKVWAAYAGDLLGADEYSDLEAYIRRMTAHNNKARAALESLALQVIVNLDPAIQPKHSEEISAGSVNAEIDNVIKKKVRKHKSDRVRVKLHPVSADLVNTGLIVQHSGARLRFINPILSGYLSVKALQEHNGFHQIQEQPAWIGKSTTLSYLAYFGDVSQIIPKLLKQDDFLRRELLRIACWLHTAPKNKPWRSLVLRNLVSALNSEKQTLSFAARIATAIALSGDPGVSMLFRQLLHSDNDNLRHLAALASGLSADEKAVDELSMLFKDRSPSIVRSACLALVAIGNKPALETVADALLHGNEHMRRAAAEALANHPVEGHPALQEGSMLDDLRVRHSVIFGLLRIKEPWAMEILNRMQMEDQEWLVRNSAIQALEELSISKANIPKPCPDLTEFPWLNDYAARLGMGVAPGNPAYAMVIEALKNGTEQERLQALNYLSSYGESTSIPVIYSWFFGGKGEIKDAAYQTLWLLATSGSSLPQPEIYGFSQG